MKNVIITTSDEKYGHFLIDHWLKSLLDNVNTKNLDIVVLDYGLSQEQIRILKEKKVIVYKCVRDGFPNSTKFRDMKRFLEKRKYDQVLTCDGGDIIFQDDISPIFKNKSGSFRAVYEKIRVPFEVLIERNFDRNEGSKIHDLLGGKKLVNAGLIIGPRKKFIELCYFCDQLMKNKSYGPDQIAINYFLLNGQKLDALDQKYNFIILFNHQNFYIKDGIFYLKNGKKIPIVHNAGWKPFLRPINNFGYGPDRNKLKIEFPLLEGYIKFLSFISKIIALFGKKLKKRA
jgi:lipopolysaccharide biosynthesis glycosyltransferase